MLKLVPESEHGEQAEHPRCRTEIAATRFSGYKIIDWHFGLGRLSSDLVEALEARHSLSH